MVLSPLCLSLRLQLREALGITENADVFVCAFSTDYYRS
jgi:hypothetical protein